LIIIKEK